MRRLEEHKRTIEQAIRAIEHAGEDAVAERAAAVAERQRLLATNTAFTPAEMEKVEARLADRVEKAQTAIAAAASSAWDAIEDSARQARNERARAAVSEAVSNRWRDVVRPLLDRGVNLPEILDLFAGDSLALSALEVNLPAYQASKSGSVNAAREEIDASLHAIEQRLLPHLLDSDREFREDARSVHGLAAELAGWQDFAAKQAVGAATPQDRAALAYRIADVPTG